MAALLNKIGPGTLFSHSQAGGPGDQEPERQGHRRPRAWQRLHLLEGEPPSAMPSAAGTLTPEAVPLTDFDKLTRIPIIIYYGDNFPTEPTTERSRGRLAGG